MFKNLVRIPPGLQPRDAFTQFGGGLDQETPAWTVKPGYLRDARNYEHAIEGGYRDVLGYERFDGRPAPSEASFTILDVTITGSIEVGDTVTGATSAATGVVVAIATYPDDVTQTYLVLTKVTGTFDETNENLTVSAVVEGNTDAEGYADSAPTAKLAAQYKNLAADEYRDDIQTVPGEDAVWGGFSLGAVKYAIRNKVGGLSAALYESTTSGWTEVDLGREIAFTSGGTTPIEEGDTITGATSGATAVVKRIQVTSGTWAGGDAAGWITFTSQTGTFQAENLNVGIATNLATIAGNSAAITLAPDGRLDHDISNFADPQGAKRVYGADGANTLWEFDGTVFAKIRTGMTDDTPDHVIEFKRHVFVSFGGSVQHSPIGAPFDKWSVVLGAAEIATGETVTGFQVLPGAEGNAALLIACRQRFFILYGNDSSDWNLVPYRANIGAYEWTLQQVAQSIFLDDRGISDLQTAQSFGNFAHNALSDRVRKLVNEKRTLACASCVVRDKNQYRLFFSDKTAIYVTLQGVRVLGMMPVTLQHEVTTAWSEEDPDGNEEVFFGSDDGYVYQMERGTSFDGADIFAYLYTHFDHSGSMQWDKEYLSQVTVEGKGTGYAEFDLTYELDYGNTDTPQPNSQTAALAAAEGSEWDAGIGYDTGFYWDNASLVPTVGLELRGVGRNISWVISKNSDYMEPLLLTGVHYNYLPRRQLRG